jgi:hypothetical protein
MRPLAHAALLVVAVVLPAASQSPAEMIADAVDIPVEEWREMAMGRTLTYRIDGEFWALEHYYPGTNRVTQQLYDGTCLEGTWDYRAPHYCFHWETEGTACFRHARLGEEILIVETQGGVDTLLLQSMTAVTDLPLACGPAVTS